MTEMTEEKMNRTGPPTPSWRQQARTALRNYPGHKEKVAAVRGNVTSADRREAPLPPEALGEYEAVRFALQCTMAQYPRDWQAHLELIRLLYWGPDRLSLAGAAMRVPCSWETAQQWHAAFLSLVDAACRWQQR